MIVVFVFVPLLFPDGRPPGPRWRLLGWAGAFGGLVLFFGTAFEAGRLENYPWVATRSRSTDYRLRSARSASAPG